MSRAHALVSLGGLLALGSCVSTNEYLRLKGEKEALQRQHDDLVRYQKEVQDHLAGLTAENAQLQAVARDADAVRNLQRQLQQTLDRLKSGESATLELKALEGVSIVQRADGVGFQVEGAVLFDSGQATIKDSGKETLRKLVPDLVKAGAPIRVDGHTDSDPIERSRWRSNLHLSSERASQVADFLVGAGVPAERVSVAGFGEHRPVDSAASEEAKRHNRRVEILLTK